MTKQQGVGTNNVFRFIIFGVQDLDIKARMYN